MVSHTFGIDLSIVPLSDVHPHEVPDPGRVTRLQGRIRDEGTLRDPIMVARIPDFDGFVLLDGTNRRAALEFLGCARVLAQIVDYQDAQCVGLLTWSHLVDLDPTELIDRFKRIPGVHISSMHQSDTDQALEEPTSLAAVHHGNDSWLLSRTTEEDERPSLLMDMVASYEEHMQREARDTESIEEKLSEVRARPGGHNWPLVTFPPITKQQVTQLAVKGTPIPAGISRHVVRCGRALRVNVPLSWLNPKLTHADAEAELEQHLSNLRPRRYLEPTILFDS